jgi:hypothetical protein
MERVFMLTDTQSAGEAFSLFTLLMITFDAIIKLCRRRGEASEEVRSYKNSLATLMLDFN